MLVKVSFQISQLHIGRNKIRERNQLRKLCWDWFKVPGFAGCL
jgi:hypothetical protein